MSCSLLIKRLRQAALALSLCAAAHAAPSPPAATNPDGDPDGDGLTNAIEAERRTNPNMGDTDADGKSDLDDAVGYDAFFTFSAAPELRYTMLDLTSIFGTQGGIAAINNRGDIAWRTSATDFSVYSRGIVSEVTGRFFGINNHGAYIFQRPGRELEVVKVEQGSQTIIEYPYLRAFTTAAPESSGTWTPDDSGQMEYRDYFYRKRAAGLFADILTDDGEIWSYYSARLLTISGRQYRYPGDERANSVTYGGVYEWGYTVDPWQIQEEKAEIRFRGQTAMYYHTEYEHFGTGPNWPGGAANRIVLPVTAERGPMASIAPRERARSTKAYTLLRRNGDYLCTEDLGRSSQWFEWSYDAPYAEKFPLQTFSDGYVYEGDRGSTGARCHALGRLPDQPGLWKGWVRSGGDPVLSLEGPDQGGPLRDGGTTAPPVSPGIIGDNGQMLVSGSLWRNGRILSGAELLADHPAWNQPITLQHMSDNGVFLAGTANRTVAADGTPIPPNLQHPYPVLLLPFDMAVDSNRDGFIKFAGNYNDSSVTGIPYDKTEETKPFAFWLNDDDDRNDKDAVDSSHKDSDDGTINSRRDLEDFSRLNIFVGGLHEAITAGQIKVGLKWKNTGSTSPRVKVWRNKSPNGGSEYLTDDDVAQEHMALGNPGDVHGATPYIIPTQFWTDSSLSESQPNGYLLFEAVSEGKGQLCITLHKEDGSEIGEGPGVWLDLKNVKKMYVRAKGTPENGIDAPFESYFSQPNPPPTGYVDDPNGHPFQQPHDEADSLIVLVHGIHAPFTASPDAYKGNIVAAEIVFKRLWHQGFKGRFAFYKWPALNPAGFGSTGFRFNESEYRAWKYGRGLALFVNSINKSSKNLFSHSQGNIVCGAALTDYGLSVDNYVLTQAAVPAGCYDTSGGQSDPTSINGYARFWHREASKPTPDYASDLGYRGYLQNLNVSGNVRNFHNQFDFALVTGRWPINSPPFPEVHWEANQDSYKPDDSLSNQNYYTYLPENPPGQRGYLGDAFFVGRFVTDPYESMSMIARPRSKAVGALGATRGKIGRDYDLSVLRNSAGELTFTRSDDDHGAQVGRRIQEVWPYYTELGRTFGVIPLPE